MENDNFWDNRLNHLFLIALCGFSSVWMYHWALIMVLESLNSSKMGPYMLKNAVSIIFLADCCILNFFGRGKSAYFQCMLMDFSSSSKWWHHVSSPATMCHRNCLPSLQQHIKCCKLRPICYFLWCSVSVWSTHWHSLPCIPQPLKTELQLANPTWMGFQSYQPFSTLCYMFKNDANAQFKNTMHAPHIQLHFNISKTEIPTHHVACLNKFIWTHLKFITLHYYWSTFMQHG